jgi:hypothetical protein
MSDFTVIRAVSKTLEAILTAEITNSSEPEFSGGPAVVIELGSPAELAGSTGVSVWLYRVARNASTLNQPRERIAPNQLKPQPLTIDLHYLVTPLANKAIDEQVVLGRVLQVFHDPTIMRGGDLLDILKQSPLEFRLTLETLTLEEISRIWGALKEPYRASLSYCVEIVNIDSRLEAFKVAPVAVRDADYVQILSSN